MDMRRLPVLILIFLSILATSRISLSAQSNPAQPQSDVRVGIYDNAPKIHVDTAGRPAGLFVELIDEIARQEDWKLRYVGCEWARCLEMLSAGDIDLMPDVAFSEERYARFDFHRIAVTHSWSVILYHPRNPILALPDLEGSRIAILRGAIQEKELEKILWGMDIGHTLIFADTLTDAFDLVVRDEADAVVSNSFFANLNSQRHGLRESPIVFNPASLYFATAKDRNGNLLERIDHYLSQWRYDSESLYFDALRRTMAAPPGQAIPGALLWLLIAGACLLLISAVVGVILRWQVGQRTAELQNTTHRLNHLLNASPTLLYQLEYRDGRTTPVWVSDNIKSLFGFEPAQVFEPGWWIRQLHPEDRDSALARLAQIQRQQNLVHEYRIYDGTGRIRHIRDEMRFIPDTGGRNDEIIGSWSDLTEAHEQAERLAFLTNFDPLTHLPNRLLLRDRLTQAIHQARREGTSLSVLVIDLDRFKNINDTLGHPVGDHILRATAAKIGEALRPGDTLARLGGDEFVMLMQHEAGVTTATQMARTLLQSFSRPLIADEHQLVITASIGISTFPTDGEDGDTLLKNAELALYEAKNQGRNDFRFFASSLSVGVLEQLVMENALRDAIKREELVLHYQPQYNLTTGALVGVEALVRWRHPDIGLVPPGQFIPLAEETGIIGEIGVWVLHEACRQAIAWQSEGFAVPRIAVNLSVQQLQGDVLARQVAEALRETGLEPGRLELEVTESTIMREPESATATLASLRTLGVKLAIDDFGTGYSSLAYLKRLPLDRLKIDKSFVKDIGHDASDEAISRAVIGLARSLGLETVAEGIERAEQAEFLRREGCDIGQGYLYSRPQPAEAVPQTCSTGNAGKHGAGSAYPA
jgi:diguanylate cyclase (GGDEF)-like protein